MAKNTRTKQKRESDLERIARLYLRGVRQVDIAAKVGISQQQVSYDLKELQRRWQANAIEAISEAKSRELARIDNLEREYWRAWGDSRKVKIETFTDIRRGTYQTIKRDGAPSYLAGVQWCIEQRCKILGIYAATRNEHSGPNGKPIPVATEASVNLKNLSFDELLSLKTMAEKARGANE